MFKQVVDAARQMLFLLRDVEQNKDDIASLKEKDIAALKEDVASLKEGLAETNHLVRQLAFEIQRSNENERQEREKFILRASTLASVLMTASPRALVGAAMER